jgi:hypothetical protein
MRHNLYALAHGNNDTNDQGVPIMDSRNDFADKFRQILKSVPEDYTLEQWQHAYRQAIFLMGMKILERFEEEAIAGPRRIAEGGGDGGGRREGAQPELAPGVPVIVFIDSHGGGQGGGWNPSIFRPCNPFPDYPLSLQDVADSIERSRRKA